jgi:hypothetical protein
MAALALAAAIGSTRCAPPTPPSCALSVLPTSLSLPPDGGSATVTVTTGSTCAWTASATSWLTVTSGSSGTGSGTVVVSAGANLQAPRSATLAVNDRRVTVTQDAAAAPAFALSGRVTDVFLGPAFGLGGVSVTMSGGPSQGSARSDASGSYTIAGLAAGTYTVTFTRAFYTTATATVAIAGDASLPMTLALDVPAVPSTANLTGYWSGTGTYPNAPFKLALIQDGAVFRGMYVDQHDSSPSVAGSPSAPEFTLVVNFGDAFLLLECTIEDEREINGIQRTPALGNRPFPFTMKR